MKMSLRSTLALALFTVVTPAVAHAQLIEPMKFTTTFPFTVGRTHFAPGAYVARPLDGDPSVVCVQPEHGGKAAFIVGIGEQPRRDPARNEVTFVREGSQFVLKSLWNESDGEGVDVAPAPAHANAN